MSNISLYRKYRPANFKEVIGQDQVVSILEGEIKNETISHAYLFSGSRGTGKTSVARIFAKAIGVSESDIYEMDAASNREIDDIREIRENVNTLPFESKYKVYIIDEAHMLTPEAWNAFLKTLEEPPAHAIFILATTEEDKVPETILSRCERYIFNKPNQSVIREVIERTAKKEGYSLEGEAADLIALMAEGSFRDALGLLQKILGSSSSKKISLELVEKVTGAPRISLVNDIISSITKKDANLGLTALSKAAEGNVDMKIMAKLLIQKLRQVLLLRFSSEAKKEMERELSKEEFAFVSTLAETKESNINSSTLVEFLGAYDAIGKSYIPHLPLELAIMKITSSN